MNIDDFQERYERWWLHKHCRLRFQSGAFKRVIKVKLVGPPSFVYGTVWLCFEGGEEVPVMHGDAFKPRKCDVEVQP